MRAEPSSAPSEPAATGARARDEDAVLVARAQAGDERAFARLVEHHGQQVLALCYGWTFDRELAEDLAQDVFIAAWLGLAGFRAEAAFSTWLHAIARNACIDSARRRAARPAVTPLDDHDELEAPLNRQAAGTEVLVIVADLSPALRQTLLLREIQGLSYEEIATLQSVPVGTVRSRLSSARGFVADRLRG